MVRRGLASGALASLFGQKPRQAGIERLRPMRQSA
jgi:hypothetical protein